MFFKFLSAFQIGTIEGHTIIALNIQKYLEQCS